MRRSKLPDHNSQDPKRDSAHWDRQKSGRSRGRWSGRAERPGGGGGTPANGPRRGNAGRKAADKPGAGQQQAGPEVGPEGVVAVAVVHDLSSSRNLSEARGERLPPPGAAGAIMGEPGSVDGAHQAPSSDFVPKCDIMGKDALSALHRAGSQQCRQEIANIVCQHQAGQLMPDALPQFCPQLGEQHVINKLLLF